MNQLIGHYKNKKISVGLLVQCLCESIECVKENSEDFKKYLKECETAELAEIQTVARLIRNKFNEIEPYLPKNYSFRGRNGQLKVNKLLCLATSPAIRRKSGTNIYEIDRSVQVLHQIKNAIEGKKIDLSSLDEDALLDFVYVVFKLGMNELFNDPKDKIQKNLSNEQTLLTQLNAKLNANQNWIEIGLSIGGRLKIKLKKWNDHFKEAMQLFSLAAEIALEPESEEGQKKIIDALKTSSKEGWTSVQILDLSKAFELKKDQNNNSAELLFKWFPSTTAVVLGRGVSCLNIYKTIGQNKALKTVVLDGLPLDMVKLLPEIQFFILSGEKRSESFYTVGRSKKNQLILDLRVDQVFLDLTGERDVGDQFVHLIRQYISNLDGIVLDGTSVTDEGVRVLAEMCPDLQEIGLNGTKVTDKGVSILAERRPGLREVDLRGTSVTDKGMEVLAERCPGLREVDLRGTSVTDKGVRVLAERCPGLWEVDLRGTSVTDEGLRVLAEKCPDLQWINLSGTSVTDKGVRALAEKCPDLRWINLSGTKVTDEGARVLAEKSPDLRWIYLYGTKVTDKGAKALAEKCPNLQKTIYFSRTNVTDQGCFKFNKPGIFLRANQLEKKKLGDLSKSYNVCFVNLDGGPLDLEKVKA